MNKRTPLSFFADPRPGELFYSCLARNQHCFPRITMLLKHYLNGNHETCPSLLAVNNLNNVLEVLSDRYSREGIVYDNTIIPYYLPFLPEERRKRLLGNLDSQGRVTQILGIYRKNFKKDPFELKYCFGCLVNDLNKHGTACFHVHEMIPGLDICPEHGYYLSTYPVPVDQFTRNLVFPDKDAMLEEPEKCRCCHELQLAKSFQQVKDHQEVTGELVRENYFKVLRSRGYCKGNRVDFKKLYKDFKEYYGDEYLRQKGCLLDVEDLNSSWFVFYRNHNKEGIVQPYRILLLINFLCGDFENFLKEGNETDGLSQKSWVCKNPACSHYRTDEKTDCNVVFDGKRSRVIVKCDCGMVYSTHFNNPRKCHVLQSGNLLYDKLNSLKKQGVPISKMAETAGLTKHQVATVLENDPVIIDKKVKQARETLDKLMLEDENLNRTSLQKHHRSTYYALSTYDWEYFNEKLPKTFDPSVNLSRVPVDYDELDEEYLQRVQETIDSLLKIDPAVRITKGLVLKQLGVTSKFIKKLPLTSQLIESAFEDSDKFNIRKGKQAVDLLVSYGTPVTKSALQKMGVRIYRPKVKKVVFEYYNHFMND